MRPPSHREIFAIAIPITVSNLSTPLLGVVDTAVVGRLPDPAHVGAVALGALVFTFVFWGFGFLRMGTTGLTAQAFGADDAAEVRASLGRALIVAGAAGMGLIALQWPIRAAAFSLIDGSSQVESLAQAYFDVRIWAAPASLANYAILGWFVGLGRARTALVLSLVLNLTNMVLDAVLVLGFDAGVEGVAAGTLVAEVVASGVGLAIAAQHLRTLGGRFERARLLEPSALRRTLLVSGDIAIRSLALVSVFVFFMAQGASQGEVLLAANAVLMHLVSISAYFLDGIAFSAEALVGRAVGARSRSAFVSAARRTTVWAVLVACVLAVGLWFGGELLVEVMVADPATRQAAREYLPWAALAPLAGVLCFQLDGVFIGATRTADMRNAMLASLAIFLGGWWLLRGHGNHGLWASLYVHYAARTLTLGAYAPRLARSVGSGGT